MSGATNISDDGRLRTPMSWTANTSNAGFSGTTPYRALSGNVASQNVAAQAADPNSILAFYKAMLKLRNSLPSLAQGSYEQAFASGNLLGYQRLFGQERTIVLINYGSSAVTAAVASLPANAALINAYPVSASDATADAAGLVSITIAAQSLRVFSLR
jgi:glycosidase